MKMRALTIAGLLSVALIATACDLSAVPPTASSSTAPSPSTAATTATRTVTASTAPGTITVTATPEIPASTPASSSAPADPFAPRQATVERLIDGDTVVLQGGERIRVIGIDTPEISAPVQCHGPEALVNAEELLPVGAEVRIIPDRSQGLLDRYGRTLAYIQTPEDLDFGYVQIQEGAAREYTYTKSRPYERQARYRQAQTESQAQNLGLWTCPPSPPPVTASPSTPATTTG